MRLIALVCLPSLWLAACSASSPAPPPASTQPASAAQAAPGKAPAPTATPPVAAADTATPGPVASEAGGIAGSIQGAILEGNRAPPAVRVCAQPVGGGAPTCTETAAGAATYSLAVAPGRYTLRAQALGDDARVFMHAERIRCIRAPCPPDTAIVVAVASGAVVRGVDLTAGEAGAPGG